jgi:hypothetical protein
MSYDRVNPTYYQTYQQGTPFEAGAPGWSEAPWVTWGNNPNLGGRRKLATDGLGKVVAISGLGGGHTAVGFGADTAAVTSALQARAAEPAWLTFARTVATGACAYHGYKRNNQSAGWAVGWAFFGSVAPILALPIALAQGFGKPAERHAMASNPKRHRRNSRRARRR